MNYDNISNQVIYRTSPSRVGKMMIIMLGICLVGGVIFFSLWDYWISQPAPIVAMMAGERQQEVATQTGETITTNLSFVESDDLLTLGFNEIIGQEGSNPTININVGDKIIFNVDHAGRSFHSFGVTADTEGFGGIIPNSEIGSPSAPLIGGESGTSEFVAGEEGTFYYICTVAGHREQGMVGEIVVGPAKEFVPQEAAPPTGNKVEINLDFTESDDLRTLGFNAIQGEEGSNPEIRVKSGDEVTVTVTNVGRSFHSFGVVTNPEDFNSVVMDSEIASPNSPLIQGESGSVTFIAGVPGNYYYICTVAGHAIQGMQGNFIVE